MYSILSLNTLFQFILQCISVPYPDSGLCKLGMEQDSCKFTYT